MMNPASTDPGEAIIVGGNLEVYGDVSLRGAIYSGNGNKKF